MTVEELKNRIEKLLIPNERGVSKIHPTTQVIIETKHGKKYKVLTAKNHTYRAGHTNTEIFWICTGEDFGW